MYVLKKLLIPFIFYHDGYRVIVVHPCSKHVITIIRNNKFETTIRFVNGDTAYNVVSSTTRRKGSSIRLKCFWFFSAVSKRISTIHSVEHINILFCAWTLLIKCLQIFSRFSRHSKKPFKLNNVFHIHYLKTRFWNRKMYIYTIRTYYIGTFLTLDYYRWTFYVNGASEQILQPWYKDP